MHIVSVCMLLCVCKSVHVSVLVCVSVCVCALVCQWIRVQKSQVQTHTQHSANLPPIHCLPWPGQELILSHTHRDMLPILHECIIRYGPIPAAVQIWLGNNKHRIGAFQLWSFGTTWNPVNLVRCWDFVSAAKSMHSPPVLWLVVR